MWMDWVHTGPTVAAAFLASLVEGVEALTVVLAVGAVRGWRDALLGSAAALLVLALLVALFGSALTLVPLTAVQLGVGLLLLLFGMRWLRKAVLRAAGVLPLHDEATAFASETDRLHAAGVAGPGLDRVAVAAAFNIVLLEGVEVVFIVVAIGAGGVGLVWPASLGALAALTLVTASGVALRRPLSSLPENAVKFGVGALLSAFGTFWVGEGIGVAWPGADLSLPALVLGTLAVALGAVRACARVRPVNQRA